MSAAWRSDVVGVDGALGSCGDGDDLRAVEDRKEERRFWTGRMDVRLAVPVDGRVISAGEGFGVAEIKAVLDAEVRPGWFDAVRVDLSWRSSSS